MTSTVTGSFPLSINNSSQLKDQLQNLGYNCQQRGSKFEFSKEGNLEEAIDELKPIYQSFGWKTEDELTLVETHADLAMRSIYEGGRIVREFQRGS